MLGYYALSIPVRRKSIQTYYNIVSVLASGLTVLIQNWTEGSGLMKERLFGGGSV